MKSLHSQKNQNTKCVYEKEHTTDKKQNMADRLHFIFIDRNASFFGWCTEKFTLFDELLFARMSFCIIEIEYIFMYLNQIVSCFSLYYWVLQISSRMGWFQVWMIRFYSMCVLMNLFIYSHQIFSCIYV